MIKIGIELNGVVRNINKQYLKYYLKDINPEFDDTDIDLNVYEFVEKLPFPNKSDRKKFVYEDYPYEIFGCAAPMSRNLHTFINGWIHELSSKHEEEKYDVSFFSLGEEELSIQSTYFYLSKSGSRVRRVFFPKDYKEIFDEYDIIITANKDIAVNSDEKNVIVLIKKTDNADGEYFADYVYSDFEEVLKNYEDIFDMIRLIDNKHKKINWLKKIIYKIKKYFNGK